MNPQPDNPTPPTNASESTEPKVQATIQEYQGLITCDSIGKAAKIELLNKVVASAVEAARVEERIQNDVVDRAKNAGIDYIMEQRDQLQAELSRVREELQLTNEKVASFKAYHFSIHEAQAALNAEQQAHGATKRELEALRRNEPHRWSEVAYVRGNKAGREEVSAQLDQARAEVVEMTELRRDALKQWKHFGDAFLVEKARAEKAESSLAALVAARHLTDMRIAAIMTASVQNTESCVKDRIGPDHPYWSQAYADVCAAVDREVVARTKADLLERDRERLDWLETYGRWQDGDRRLKVIFPIETVRFVKIRDAIDAVLAHHTASSAVPPGTLAVEGEKAL